MDTRNRRNFSRSSASYAQASDGAGGAVVASAEIAWSVDRPGSAGAWMQACKNDGDQAVGATASTSICVGGTSASVEASSSFGLDEGCALSNWAAGRLSS